MASTKHVMEKFVPGEDFEDYIEVFEQYCVANEVQANRQVAELISAIGVETYKILKSLTFPIKPKDKTLVQIVDVLKNHFRPAANTVAERYKFHQRTQRQGETANAYVVELKLLAQTCNFGSGLADMLRDRFISGLRDNKLQRQLINTENLTFDKALSMATNWELADENVKTMQSGNADGGQCNAVAGGRFGGRLAAAPQRAWGGQSMQWRGQGVQNPNMHHSVQAAQGRSRLGPNQGAMPKRCGRCGINNPRHVSSSCWTLMKPCFTCGQFGHSAKTCRRAAQANYIDEYDDNDQHEETYEQAEPAVNTIHDWPTGNYPPSGYPVAFFVPSGYVGQGAHFPVANYLPGNGTTQMVSNNLRPVQSSDNNPAEEHNWEEELRIGHVGPIFSPPLFADLNVEQTSTRMEVDTGACTSVISYVLYLRNFSHKPLINVSKHLQVITGKKINVAGKIEVQVRWTDGDQKGSVYKFEIIVIHSNGDFVPLLGRAWLDVLKSGWRSAFYFKSVSNHSIRAVSDGSLTETIKFKEELRVKYPKACSQNHEEAIQEFKADIVLIDNFSSIFHKAYNVPFALRDKVEQELIRLCGQKILVPVTQSEWASPIIVVPKKNGEIRLCMDAKVTVNKFIVTEHYPLPRIDDIFANLSDCFWFCVLDLSGAYQQLRVSETSQKFLTINTLKGLG